MTDEQVERVLIQAVEAQERHALATYEILLNADPRLFLDARTRAELQAWEER